MLQHGTRLPEMPRSAGSLRSARLAIHNVPHIVATKCSGPPCGARRQAPTGRLPPVALPVALIDSAHRVASRAEQLNLLDPGVERFAHASGGVDRLVRTSDDNWISQPFLSHPIGRGSAGVSADLAEKAFLAATVVPLGRTTRYSIDMLDLFSGFGGLTLGVREACRALGIGIGRSVAIDQDASVLDVFSTNFSGATAIRSDVADLIDGDLGAKAVTPNERRFIRSIGSVDLLVGGPPCQGHSAFNNQTRHDDTRNALMLRMVRAAELLGPSSIIIENVPGALRDRFGVVEEVVDRLRRMDYFVSARVLDLTAIGVAQRRKRLLILASRERECHVTDIEVSYGRALRDTRWAIGDLESLVSDRVIDSPVKAAPDTARRVKYLFNHELYDLPDEQRPRCHSRGRHSYKSIYGRLRWDEPAQTITTGFYNMCMGRYVHPSLPRTLTAHEAARLQYIPDHFTFESVRERSSLARMIGNAAPLRLGYVAALELLR